MHKIQIKKIINGQNFINNYQILTILLNNYLSSNNNNDDSNYNRKIIFYFIKALIKGP